MKTRKHILIVDDVTTNLKCLGEILRNDYALTMAKSGEKAIEVMEKIKPDLVLLDVKMPGMDGYQTFSIIKSNPKISDIPVIFLTADTENDSEVKGLKLGACDFIKKPYEPDIMVERIERVLIQEERNRNIKEFALKDSLTGVWNRQYLKEFIDSLNPAVDTGSFLILDLDNFKGINDTYGHIVGDKALEIFARTLEGFVHKDDVIARIGGDEFAVFLKDAYGSDLLKNRIDGLIREVENKLKIIKEDDTVNSVSVGVSSYPFDGSEFIDLYMCADKALYYVKHNGKSGCHFYSKLDSYDFSDTGLNEPGVLNTFFSDIDKTKTDVGPFRCEYDNFKSIFIFLKRYIRRSGSVAQVILFSVKDLAMINSEAHSSISGAVSILEGCIKDSLRKNDVSMKYTASQVMVILMDVDENNQHIVIDRIMKLWNERNSNPNYILTYENEKI